jgi:hypothetical protein
MDPVAETARRYSERLLGGIEVMELQGRLVPVVPTGHTASTGLLHQDPLDFAAPLRDALLGA